MNNWIECEEGLPPSTNTVIVALNYGYGNKTVAVGWYSRGNGTWYIDDNEGEYICEKYLDCDVTHWIPLPKYPED